MRILGIETSCDETAVCLIEAEGNLGADFTFRILGNGIASQAVAHADYGGVFPNLAKREHGRNLVPMLEIALRESGALNLRHEKGLTMSFSRLRKSLKNILAREPELFERLEPFLNEHARPDVDAIAVTVGPGLEPALWVGINFARALSLAWNLPIVAANHMEGNIVKFEFPAVTLLISGGHTELILMKEWMQYEYLGRTRDDAVGEAFDKVARMIGLPYPGGPHISRLAEDARQNNFPRAITLPRPMLNEDTYDFSFSGLKTAVLRFTEKRYMLSEELKKQIAREFEDAVTEVLIAKTIRAVEEFGVNTVVVGGGVSANTHIRLRLTEALAEAGVKLLLCPVEYSTDNAVMIALAGYFHALKKEFAEPDTLRASGNLLLA